MADETTATVETTDAPGMDMEAASDQIGASLFPETDTPDTPVEAVTEAVVTAPEPATTPAPVMTETAPLDTTNAPASWPKDMRAHWAAMPKPAQEYWQTRERQMKDGVEQYREYAEYGKQINAAIAPYQPHLQAMGTTAPDAFKTLLEAHYRLTQGSLEERRAAYDELGRNLRLPPVAPTVPGQEPPPVDPRLQTMEQQLQQLQQVMTQQQQAVLQEARQKAGAEVHAFATATQKDGTLINAFFDEVHDDIVKFIAAGDPLQVAYDKAVWANPVTREKQKLAYFQTESEKAKERARLDALPKQKARGVNVNGRDTHRTPTEPLGSLEDTMKDTAKAIRERTVH